MSRIGSFFAPAPHVARLPEAEVKRRYPALRWSILESTFLGYASFYLLRRHNLAIVGNELGTVFQISNSMYGNIMAVASVSYGLGKFLLGSISDRSNPRRFMPFGLALTALLNFLFAGVGSMGLPNAAVAYVFMGIWALNGFVQGMGWPPCGRSMGHWFSVRERGLVFAGWNTAHNVGGGLAGVIAAWGASSLGWQGAFYVPGIICLVMAAYLGFRLRDTPQSVGLPPVEEYRNDYPPEEDTDHEKELDTYDLFVNYILKNKLLWIFALANFFVYISRYSMLDWGPKYLAAIKGGDLKTGGIAHLILEWGGIPSTIIMGWLSDRFDGRRGMVSLLCMFPVLGAFVGLYLNPPGNLTLDLVLLGVVGFFIYPPVMLLGVAALDLTSKKAVGAAAGFVGLWGYLGTGAQGVVLGQLSEIPGTGWDLVVLAIIGSTMLGIVLLAFTWKVKPRG